VVVVLKKKIAYEYLDTLFSLRIKYRRHKKFAYAVDRCIQMNRGNIIDYYREVARRVEPSSRVHSDDEVRFEVYQVKESDLVGFLDFEISSLKKMRLVSAEVESVV
jgi:hypothetical protein